MLRGNLWLAAVGVIVAGLLSAPLGAQASAQTGAVTYVSSGATIGDWYFDVDFGATAVSVDISITIDLQTAGDAKCQIKEITSMSQAATNQGWFDAQAFPLITTGPALAGPLVVYGANAVAPFTANTVMLSGINRIHFEVQPDTNPPAADVIIDVTISTTIGTPVGGIQPDFWSTYPTGGGLMTVGASDTYIRHYSNQAFGILVHKSASDEIQYNLDVIFPATAAPTDISVRGLTGAGVTGNLDLDFYDLSAGGGSTPQISISISDGNPDCQTYTTAALSGIQKFRLVVRPGAGYGGTSYLINFFITFGSNTFLGATGAAPPIPAVPPVAITPSGGAISIGTGSSYALTASGGTPAPSYTWTEIGSWPAGFSLGSSVGANSSIDIAIGTTPQTTAVTVRCSNGTDEWVEETYTVTVTGAVPTPIITVSTSSLAAFVTTGTSVPSAEQTYTVSGSNLTAGITVTAPAAFEISLTTGSGFTGTFTLPQSGGSVATTTIFVRYNPPGAGPDSGDISNASTGATTENVAVTGSISSTPTVTVSTNSLAAFVTTGTSVPSAEQSYTVSGSNLTAGITVTAPAAFEISLTTGSGFTGTFTLPQSGGTVATTTIFVRYNPPGAGPDSGNISNASTGASTENVAVTGSISVTPTITLNPTSRTFNTSAIGVPSAQQSYTVSAVNLTGGALTITAPTEFEISTTSGGPYSGGVSLPIVGGSVAATTIYVRYNPGTAGPHSGDITHTDGTTSGNVALTGTIGGLPPVGSGSGRKSSSCVAGTGQASWLALLAVLMLLGIAIRVRSSRE